MIGSIFDMYALSGDVQMLATLACILKVAKDVVAHGNKSKHSTANNEGITHCFTPRPNAIYTLKL